MADVGFDLGSPGLKAHGLDFLSQLWDAQNVLGSVLAWWQGVWGVEWGWVEFSGGESTGSQNMFSNTQVTNERGGDCNVHTCAGVEPGPCRKCGEGIPTQSGVR